MFCQRFLRPSSFSCLIIPVRGSIWPSNYVMPIFRKEDQAAMDEEERRKLAFAPVRAAVNNVTPSVFFDPVILHLTKKIMRHGRMHLARRLMDETLAEIKKTQIERYRNAKTDAEREDIELDPVLIVKQAVKNMTPVVITRPIKRGGATYQVPHPIAPHMAERMAMKWLTDAIKERPKPQKEGFEIVLARELLAGFENEGKVVKRKVDMHRACEANKAYAHYRWG